MASKVGAAFSTADAAAIAAIEEINPTSIKNKWEYAGRIYTRSGTSTSPGRPPFGIRIFRTPVHAFQ